MIIRNEILIRRPQAGISKAFPPDFKCKKSHSNVQNGNTQEYLHVKMSGLCANWLGEYLLLGRRKMIVFSQQLLGVGKGASSFYMKTLNLRVDLFFN